MNANAAGWDQITVKAAGGLSPETPFPWGKHKGVPIGRVPRDYLIWALNNADAMRPELRTVIQSVLGIAPEEGKQEEPANQEANNLRRAWEHAVKRVKEQQAEIKALKAQLATAASVTMGDVDQFRRVIKGWYRAMSLVYHPDRGGTKESQAILNACYSDLIRRLEGDQP